MVKRFCDRCGKEIFREYYDIKWEKLVNGRYYNSAYDMICKECKIKYEKFMKNENPD